MLLESLRKQCSHPAQPTGWLAGLTCSGSNTAVRRNTSCTAAAVSTMVAGCWRQLVGDEWQTLCVCVCCVSCVYVCVLVGWMGCLTRTFLSASAPKSMSCRPDTTCPRPGWVSMLLLERLRKQCNHPGSRTHLEVRADHQGRGLTGEPGQQTIQGHVTRRISLCAVAHLCGTRWRRGTLSCSSVLNMDRSCKGVGVWRRGG